MQAKAIFYHAGCPVCVEAERSPPTALDPKRYTVEGVHLGTTKERVLEAEREPRVAHRRAESSIFAHFGVVDSRRSRPRQPHRERGRAVGRRYAERTAVG